jgi:hypothetical protein
MTLALAALALSGLLAPATSVVASPTHPQPARVAHALAMEAVLPSDSRGSETATKDGEPT